MPGATTAMLVCWVLLMLMKEFMMPQTVPKRPMNGAAAPTVASTPNPRPACSSSRAIWACIRRSHRSTIIEAEAEVT
jgi:hypothetical protein